MVEMPRSAGLLELDPPQKPLVRIKFAEKVRRRAFCFVSSRWLFTQNVDAHATESLPLKDEPQGAPHPAVVVMS